MAEKLNSYMEATSDELGDLGNLGDLGDLEHNDVVAAYKKALDGLNESCSDINTGIFREEYVIFILAISFLLLIMLIARRNKDIAGFSFAFNYIFLVAISIAEIGYLIEHDNPLWFCRYDDVGFNTAITGFFLFLGIILIQLYCFIISMIDCSDNYHAEVNLKLGYYSLILGIIATVICVNFWAEGIVYFIIGVVAAQLIQFVMIIIGCARGRNIFLSIPFIFLYSLSIIVLLVSIIKIIA